jgi:hypothetical protein
MKIKPKMALSFGDLIAAAPKVWGAGRAQAPEPSASQPRPAAFREPTQLSILPVKGKSA